ncbi:hypothetical protein J2795_001339 [Chryseobacterium bernardetii]|uniref:Uncharacterized protein n=2 Tax=Chryseobacterium TaxID=59732 RepID=A0A543EJD3_9FLAO|nr:MULTISPECIES: hypothetical protein [Chryseobacterium]MDR6370118.1 hypothetical protein [Chryseobacterium vietnamense]MDR6440639.1 hypothetical protein [Chryseobacterium bernardetii]TQM21678.1 hypothetical protein FB551_1370 [Chryseobacterium aquifrigidense]
MVQKNNLPLITQISQIIILKKSAQSPKSASDHHPLHQASSLAHPLLP